MKEILQGKSVDQAELIPRSNLRIYPMGKGSLETNLLICYWICGLCPVSPACSRGPEIPLGGEAIYLSPESVSLCMGQRWDMKFHPSQASFDIEWHCQTESKSNDLAVEMSSLKGTTKILTVPVCWLGGGIHSFSDQVSCTDRVCRTPPGIHHDNLPDQYKKVFPLLQDWIHELPGQRGPSLGCYLIYSYCIYSWEKPGVRRCYSNCQLVS